MEERWIVGTVHSKASGRIAMEADGTIFFRRKGRNPRARGQVHCQFWHEARAWDKRDECNRPARGLCPSLSSSLFFADIPSPSFFSQCPRLCTHVRRAWGRSPRCEEVLARPPPPPRGRERRSGRDVAATPLHLALSRATMPAPVCGGARRCHIDRALVTGERTNQRTNFSLLSPLFLQRIALFSLCLSRDFSLLSLSSSLTLLFFSFPTSRLEKKQTTPYIRSSSRNGATAKRWCTWLTQRYRTRVHERISAYNDQTNARLYASD